MVFYIVEQYLGTSLFRDGANRAPFTAIAKNKANYWRRQTAFNIARGLMILRFYAGQAVRCARK